MLELGLRVFGVFAPPQGAFFVIDASSGWANRPGAAGEWNYEGRAYVRINSAGLRDHEHSTDKPPNILRLAVLGDSFAAAFQVPQSDDFCSVAERMLRSCAGLNGRVPEVINFGVNAYGTAQELITLERRTWQYRPDIVVLAFYPNDLYDNSRKLTKIYPEYTLGPRPYFHYEGANIALDDSFRSSRRFRKAVEETAYDYGAYGEGIHRLMWKLRLWQILSRLRFDLRNRPVEESFSASLLNPPKMGDWQDAWRVTEGLIEEMNQEVNDHQAQFLMVVVTHSWQVYPGAAARTALLERAGVDDPLYLNDRLKALAQHDRFGILSLAEPMQQYADEHHVFLHGFHKTLGHGHWNKLGHQLAGEMIAHKICEMLEGQASAPRTALGESGGQTFKQSRPR
jgi:hypothetical protein